MCVLKVSITSTNPLIQMEFMMVIFLFCFVLLLSHFWRIHFFLPTPALSTISRPLSSYMCSITPETANVSSSYNRMRGPGIECWFADRSNYIHWSFGANVLPINPNNYTDQWEPIVLYHSITFTDPYTTMQPVLLTSWLQLLSYKVWTITAEVCTVAVAIASVSVRDVPVGYSTFHVDLAS